MEVKQFSVTLKFSTLFILVLIKKTYRSSGTTVFFSYPHSNLFSLEIIFQKCTLNFLFVFLFRPKHLAHPGFALLMYLTVHKMKHFVLYIVNLLHSIFF